MNARALLVPALALLACGGRGTLFDASLKALPLVATPSAMVSVIPGTERAVLLAPGDAHPRASRLSKGSRWAGPVPHSEQVAVLGGTAKHPVLDVVDAITGEVQTLELPGAYDVVTFSPDGRFAVLSYVASGGTGQLTARNLNEIGLWTLGAGTVDRLQLDTESLAPRQVIFAPAEANRQLVAVALDRGVAVFDALHPQVAPRRITITPPGSTSESTVVEALFSRDVKWLFLRASLLDDVIVIELGSEVGRAMNASINFVSGGRGLTDIAVPPPGYETSVVALYAASGDAWLLDAHGIQDDNRRLSLTLPATIILPLQGTKLLFWDANRRSVQAWDVADGRSGAQQLPGFATQAIPVPGRDQVLFPITASADGSGAALSLVTVTDDTNRLRLSLSGIQLSSPLGAAALESTGQRLFFGVTNGASLVTLELSTLRLSEVQLDASVVGVLHLPVPDVLVVSHQGSLGDVSLVPAGSTERSTVTRFTNFALTGDLDRAEATP